MAVTEAEYQQLVTDVQEDIDKGLYTWIQGEQILNAALAPAPTPATDEVVVDDVVSGVAQGTIAGTTSTTGSTGTTSGTTSTTGGSTLTPEQQRTQILNDFKARSINSGDAERLLIATGMTQADARQMLSNTGLIRYATDTVIAADVVDSGSSGGSNEVVDSGPSQAEIDAELQRLAALAESNTVAGPEDPGAEFGRLNQYLNALGIGATGGGPAGAYQRSLFNPLERLYGLDQGITSGLQGLEGFEGATVGPFGQYLNRGQNSAAQIYGRAGDLLRSLYAAGGAERADRGLTFGSEVAEPGESLINSSGISTQAQQQLFNLALRPRFGAAGASRFAGRLGTERDIFTQQQSLGTNQSGNFLDYLRNKYGLGEFFGQPALPAGV